MKNHFIKTKYRKAIQMKILIVGGKGTIGKKVANYFSENHEVMISGRSTNQYKVDISDSSSIKNLFKETGKLDAIICIAGEARWAPFEDLSEEDYYIGLRSKLMGQVNLVRIGQEFLNPGGSMTLTTGILADDPVIKTTSAAMVNGGIHSFVQAAALEMKNGNRINVVSTGMVEDAYKKYKSYFPGHNPIPMNKVVNCYSRAVEGKGNGEVIRKYD